MRYVTCDITVFRRKQKVSPMIAQPRPRYFMAYRSKTESRLRLEIAQTLGGHPLDYHSESAAIERAQKKLLLADIEQAVVFKEHCEITRVKPVVETETVYF